MTMETREPPKNLNVGKQPDGTIIYFAFAWHGERSAFGQILVTKPPNATKCTQAWTGVTYKSAAMAWRETGRLNGCEETR
jgi:hypothetical protein